MNFNRRQDEILKTVELEITLRCNNACANCNRLVGIWTPPESDMTLGQIQTFIDQTKNRYDRLGIPLDHIRIIGGEPLIHPRFITIYLMLVEQLKKSGLLKKIILVTNGILPIPSEYKDQIEVIPIPQKRHSNFFISPQDTGLMMTPCDAPWYCGIAVNAFGYFPGGACCSLIRLFGLQEEVRYDFPDTIATWSLNKICPHCVHAICPAPEGAPIDTKPLDVPMSERFKACIENKTRMLLKRLPEA